MPTLSIRKTKILNQSEHIKNNLNRPLSNTQENASTRQPSKYQSLFEGRSQEINTKHTEVHDSPNLWQEAVCRDHRSRSSLTKGEIPRDMQTRTSHLPTFFARAWNGMRPSTQGSIRKNTRTSNEDETSAGTFGTFASKN